MSTEEKSKNIPKQSLESHLQGDLVQQVSQFIYEYIIARTLKFKIKIMTFQCLYRDCF